MSSSPVKRIFTVYAPDHTDPGTLELRISVLEDHLKGINSLRSSGILSKCISLQYWPLQPRLPYFFLAEYGGALLAPEITDEKGRKKMTASLMFFEAESIEEVRKIVEADIFYTKGVVRPCRFALLHCSVNLTLFDLVE